VFCTFLDSTKAFDRVHYCKLFKLLVKHELPLLIIRVLAMNNLVRVSWGGAMTDYFTALNGVKQGAVLSPILYCVYIDDLLLILSKAGVGCFIGLHFVGALAYVGDLVLLAYAASAMRKLLAICEDYIREYKISFNALKSKCLVALRKNCRNTFKKVNDCIFYIDGRMIDFVQSFSHLGRLITSDSDDGEDITIRKHSFIGQVNNTLCYFGKLSSFVKYNLFHAYSTIYYGCELRSLSNSNVKEFCIAWLKNLHFRLTVFCYHFCLNAFPS